MEKFGLPHLYVTALLFVLLVFPADSGYAQTGTIVGTVADKETGEVLVGANIVVTTDGVETGAASDSNGTFEVTGLPAGTYSVTVSYIGYKQETISDVALSDGESRSLNIALFPTGISGNPVVVTASRHPEKLLEAPAAVSVVDAHKIENHPTLTVTDHLRGLPGVDIGTKGIVQSNMVVRGFNDIISNTMQTLVDYRYEHVPALRYNVPSVVSLTNEDISRIEVVSGPAAVLYGPNSANGVLHIITYSPFESQGTMVSVGGGGRDFFNFSDHAPYGGNDIFTASFRHAGLFSKKVGYKISGQYVRGNDWHYVDPAEPDTVVKFRPTPNGPELLSSPVSNKRDYKVEKFAGEGRMDFHLSKDVIFILNGGFANFDEIDPVQTGTGQVIGWTQYHGQLRLEYKNLFLQGFINGTNSGDTYLLRTGQIVEDRSKLFAGQIQHHIEISEQQRFTYGADALLTHPDTHGTLSGRNEDRDNIDQFGAYLQSQTKLSPKWDVVLAGRVDDHNHIDKPVFSPRAAIVFRPNPDHNFRLTYNRAYRTPSPGELFVDLLALSIPSPLNPNQPLINVRVLGVDPETGFTFRRGSDGRPLMMTQLLPPGAGYVPSDVNSIWPALRQILVAQSPAQIQALLDATLPQQLPSTVSGDLRKLNPSTGKFDLTSDVRDIDPLRPTINNTFEFGYKGVISDKLFLAFDLYHTRYKDFIAAFRTETPNVFANPQQLGGALQPTREAITNALIAQGVPPAQAEAQATEIVNGLVNSAAQFPLGVVSPEQIANDTDVILTVRNFGDVSVSGLDLSYGYYLNPNWSLSGNYSFITNDQFNPFRRPNYVIWRNLDGVSDLALNAPGNKAALAVQYNHDKKGIDAELRYRYVEGFPMNSGVHIGDIDSYHLVDLNLAYRLPFSRSTRVMLSVQNLFDKKHREFVDAPEIGRLILARIVQSF